MNQFQLQLPAYRKREHHLAPLRPLTPLQRIGYLDEVTEIECIASFEHYIAGLHYKVLTSIVQVMRFEDRKMERIEMTGQELAVCIVDGLGAPKCFMESRFIAKNIITSEGIKIDHSFDELIAHFEIPDVPSVRDLYPQRYERNLQRLRSLEAIVQSRSQANKDFRFAAHQLEDLALAAVRDGFVLAWSTGTGKCLGIICWALIKTDIRMGDHCIEVQARVLIITLGDLIEQVRDEAKSRFGIEMSILWSGSPPIINGFYICSYETIARSGVAERFKTAFDCVLVDEATKMQAETSGIGKAVRRLNPRYRCIATATPIKNRLQQLFGLLHWAAGGKPDAHPGFPFSGDKAGLRKFEMMHLVLERNYRRRRTTAEAANIHKLWKITAPLIARRRKQDVPECTTKKIERVQWVPLGTAQAEVYRRVLEAGPAVEQYQALRQAACCPWSPNLENPSVHQMTPKVFEILRLTLEILRRGEQVIIFSAFNQMSDALSNFLAEARVEHVLLDGRVGQSKRAELAARFKSGKPGVMLAGEGSMSYGHSFSEVNNVILNSEDWAMDIVGQAPDRAHRMNSRRDLNVYAVLTKQTIEEDIHELHQDKRDSSELVLDGQAPDAQAVPVAVQRKFDTLDEQELLKWWTQMKREMTDHER